MVMDDSKPQGFNNKTSKNSQALSPVKLHKVKGSFGQIESCEGEGENASGEEGLWSIARQEETVSVPPASSLKELRISQSHSKKVIKHALRQQAKRRRKNTTIAAGNSAPLPRLLVSPQGEAEESSGRSCQRPPTMLEVLSSIPGFSIKQRKRSAKKLSAAAQLQQTKEGCIDLETPDSILVNTHLRSLLNKHTFHILPPLYQYKLVQLLPHVDRSVPAGDSFRLSPSGLNNEFFARACLEWRERLAEGEFTPENQQKLKAEAEREKSKLDPWKLKHFEPIWGESSNVVKSVEWTPPPTLAPPKPPKPTVKVKTPPNPPPPPRLRTVGAITRAVANYREKREAEENSMLLEPNKRFKTSNKPNPPPVEPSRAATVKVQTEVASVRVETDLRPPDKGKPVKEETVVEKIAEQDPNITAWGNVDVISVDPVQEYVDVNTQVDKDEDVVCKSDNYVKVVCDISGRESEEKTETIEPCIEKVLNNKEEVVKGEEEKSPVMVPVEKTVQTEEESQEVDNELCPNDVIIPDNNDNEIETKSEETATVVDNFTVESHDEMKDNKNPSICGLLENDISENNTYKVSPILSHENCDTLVEEPTLEEGNEMPSQELECVESIPDDISDQQSRELVSDSQDSGNNQICVENSSDVPILNLYEERSKIEYQTLEVVVDGKHVFSQTDENVNKDKYEVEMTIVNEHLIFGNEEGPLTAAEGGHVNQELTSNQEVEPQNSLKDESSMYDMKMESELDLQETTSNNQMQESSQVVIYSQENNSQHFELTDPEVHSMQPSLDHSTDGQSCDPSFNNIYRSVLYQEALKEEEAAAIFAAAWGAVDSSTEKLLAQVALQEENEVNVIPMQEELEVRLEEIKSGPACGWAPYEKINTPLEPTAKPLSPPQYPGHVKLELEVTLTPEVSSTVEGAGVGTIAGTSNATAVSEDLKLPAKSTPPLTVIPPTTIVCLPSAVPHPASSTPATQPPQGVVSSSALPYLALTTSTPVRALPTKPKMSSGPSGGRSSRNVSSKPPPGAVNLERSYQICQAVIQNSPNRDQLRGQLKPPPSLLIGKNEKTQTQYSMVTSSRGGKTALVKQRPYQQRPTAPVLVKHVFTSSQGIPVTMAVLPHTQPPPNPEVAEGQMGHYVLVQRTGAQVRRSNSAPPSNNENLAGVGGRGRPASVGEGASSPNKLPLRSADCQCSLKAMIACKKCGAFWHDDCIDPSRVCVTCHIR